MELTVTAKILIKPTIEQQDLLLETCRAFARACNYVSNVVFDIRNLSQNKLQKEVYGILRSYYAMPSQMACNVVRHVIGNYRTIRENQDEWIKPNYNHPLLTLSWNRDYSLQKDYFSVNTLKGRIKLIYANEGLKSKEVLSLLKISRLTLTKYVKNGTIKVKEMPNGQYDYDKQSVMALFNDGIPLNTYIYARVSTSKQKADLENQIELLKRFCFERGYSISEVFSDVASGINFDKRKDFFTMLDKIIDGRCE